VGLLEAVSLQRGAQGFDATPIVLQLEKDLLEAGYDPHLPIDSSYKFADFRSLADDGIAILDMHSNPDVLVFKQFSLLETQAAKNLFDQVMASNKDLTDKMVKLVAAHNGTPVQTGWAIVVTHAGVQKIFASHKVSIFINMSCDSDNFKADFGAKNYLSYPGLCYQGEGQGWNDLQTFMNRLLGKSGMSMRKSTAAAGKLPGVTLTPDPLPPVTLAPAVEPNSVNPKDGSSVKPGRKTFVSVHFDTEVKPEPTGVVRLSGSCGKQAKVSDEKWNGSTFGLTMKVPPTVKDGDITLTIPKDKAVGESPGWESPLFGNQDGSDANGNGNPPASNYVWHLSCSAKQRNISFSGSADGFTLSGPIQADGSSVTCTALSEGVTQVLINGRLKDETQVGFELDAKSGTFGPGGTADGTATLDLYPGKPPKEDRAGGAGSGQFGTGSGTVTVNGTSGGSINATLDDGVTVSGSWTCNS
jgi:hypothetical protein